MPKTKHTPPSPMFATLALFACVPLAHAQDNVEEVVVSDYRATPGAAVPASIAVLDAQTIREIAVQHFEELTHQVPNLNWAGGVSRPRYFQIRGIGERSQYEGAPDPSVGFIVDDLDFSALGGVATLFDVDQVEVLRGPQGTRYGANALAGLIYVKYAEPGPEPEAYVTATAGSDGARALGGVVGGALHEDLTYRAVVHSHQSDGFRDNAYLGRDDTNGRDELSTRLKLRYAPGDAWRVDLTALHVELDNGYDAFAVDNGLTTYSDRPGRDTQRTSGLVLTAHGEFDERFSLTSITGAARSDVVFSFDADWGNADFWAPFVYDFFSDTRRDRQQLSQEFRLVSTPGRGPLGGRLDWVTGASIANLRESNLTRDDGDFEGFAFAAQVAREYEATNAAVFGDLDLALADSVSLSAGLRVERREADYEDSNGERFDPSETNVGGQIAVLYALDDRRTLYAKVARGYKAGGFNLALPAGASTDAVLYDAEFLWNYEVGLKGHWLDDRLGVAANAFWMQRRDQQVQTSTQLDPQNPATFFFFTDNAGRGRNLGAEVELDFAATERLALYANLGLLDTKIEQFGSDDTLDGREQAHAPAYSFALGGRLDFAERWFARLDVTGKDAFFFSDSHDQRSEAYALVNLRVGLDLPRWSFAAWARNLFDEDYAVRGFYFGNEPARDFADTLYTRQGDPRQIGLSVSYRFVR